MNWHTVATEGITADGREIKALYLEQMANNYDPDKYQARVWLEHFRGLLPDYFPALGDVLALKTDKNAQGQTVLLAQIQPLPELIKMNQSGQKLYTSIEIDPSFSDSGEAYLVGLAVTDSPASLGTSRLTFSIQKQSPHLFTPYFNQASDPDPETQENTEESTELKFELQKIKSMVENLITELQALNDTPNHHNRPIATGTNFYTNC